ncbi:MAG TPA: heme exporter protein CcmB [Gemmatimonadales bacterium]|nr:heme exporter protein CcmB [Gemmatimonadales bacterium]
MAEFLRVALAVAAKDLRLELRTRATILSAVVFAALVLIVFNFSRDPTAVASAVLAPSVLWVTVAFASVVAMNRAFTVEREHGALDGLRLAPAPRGALFTGKAVANLAFVTLIELVTVPLAVLFFELPVAEGGWGLPLILFLASIGFVAVGTLLAAMAVRTRFAELMLPVLLLPFMVPPLTAAAESTARLLAGRPLSEVAGWLRFLTVYDLVFVTLGLLLFGAVIDE